MGGVVSKAVDFVTAPSTIIGKAVGSMPVIGPIAGPIASMALGGDPFTSIGGGLFSAATGEIGRAHV